MTPSTWKGKEGEVGALFGCRRIVLSGSNNRNVGTRSDTDHERLFIEVKYGKVGAHIPAWIVKLWGETARLAAIEGKVPVLAICPKRRAGLWPPGSGLGLGVVSLERLAALEGVAAAAKAHLRGGPCDPASAPFLSDAVVKLEATEGGKSS